MGLGNITSALTRSRSGVRIWTSQFRNHAVDSGRTKATGVPSGGTNEMNTATRKVLPPRAHQLFG